MTLFDPESMLCTPAGEQSPNSVTLPTIAQRSRPPSGQRGSLAATVPARRAAAEPEQVDSGSDREVEAEAGGGSRASSCGPPPNRGHGVEEFRADPALRVALERLEAVRHRQPSADDFALERFLSRPDRRTSKPQGSRSSLPKPPAEQEDDITELEAAVDAYLAETCNEAAAVALDCGPPPPERRLQSAFSTDLLLAAARVPTPVGVDASRSTSPGSTQLSSMSSTGAISLSTDSRTSDRPVRRPPRITEGRSGPAAPPGAPPRRPGRRVLSARNRTSESPSGYRGPLSARS